MAENKKIVFVALSGGVDSSVAALLLKKQDYCVIGVFMRCWKNESSDASVMASCAEKEAEDARRVAGKLKIPFYLWNFEKEYKKRVIDYMVSGYKKGITPNPDVMCNKEIKFGLFLEKALKMGADYVATGHYVVLQSSRLQKTRSIFPARKLQLGSRPRSSSLLLGHHARSGSETLFVAAISEFKLFESKDKNKDQSYFLWTLTQRQLKYCLFPIGDYLKSEVRRIAKKADLLTAEKKDSQGICFLGKVGLDEFLGKYIAKKKGDIIFIQSGKKIGEHKGAWFYTIGQRHGLGIGGGKPYYIAEKDVKKNLIKVAEGNSEAFYKKEVELIDVNFIDQQLITNDKRQILVRIRYRQPLIKADLISHKSSVVSHKLIFNKPIKFIAPGQSAVFYLPIKAKSSKGALVKAANEMIGGGILQL